MKQEKFMNLLQEKIKNKEDLKLDLKNDVILELKFDEEINEYRGYWREENIWIGIWDFKTLAEIISGKIDDIELIL